MPTYQAYPHNESLKQDTMEDTTSFRKTLRSIIIDNAITNTKKGVIIRLKLSLTCSESYLNWYTPKEVILSKSVDYYMHHHYDPFE